MIKLFDHTINDFLLIRVYHKLKAPTNFNNFSNKMEKSTSSNKNVSAFDVLKFPASDHQSGDLSIYTSKDRRNINYRVFFK